MQSEKDPAKWDKTELERFLSGLNYSYQKIDLPYGLSTKGVKRPFLLELAFGSSLEGKTVLDLGSYLGYFCLEACQQKAKHVVGLELDPDRVKEARTLAAIKGLEPEYRIGDLESLDQEEKYDLVLCLNLLHHLYDPIAALHKLAGITRDTLIIEAAGLGRHDRSKLKMPALLLRYLKNKPLIVVRPGIPRIGKSSASQKYFITEKALVNILAGHTGLFARVEVFPSEFKDRFIIKATRRKIGHLLIVAGPTSSGKSSFLRALEEKRLNTALKEKLPVSAHDWPQLGASKLLNKEKTSQGDPLPDYYLEGLVLHYDLLRPYSTGTHSYERDQALDLLHCADQVTVVTIKPPREQLIRQLQESELSVSSSARARGSRQRITPSLKKLPSAKMLKKVAKAILRPFGLFPAQKSAGHHHKLASYYQDEQWLKSWYDRWSNFVKTAKSDAVLLTVEPAADQEFNWQLAKPYQAISSQDKPT